MSFNKTVTQLKNRLPQDSWSTDQTFIAPYLDEWRDRWQGVTPLLLRPKTTQEVVLAVGICAENSTPLCLQGGNTGLVGGQIPQGEILLSTQRLKSVRKQTKEILTVESGLRLSAVHQIADSLDRKFPLTLASEGSATIGGLCSTNAGGMHVVRYGSMRDLVNGLELVLADGSILNTLEPLKKDNTGYALTPLFLGAEGTLGIITAATLKLVLKPAVSETLLLAVTSPHLATVLYRSLQEKFHNELSIIELIPDLAIDWVSKADDSCTRPFSESFPWYVLIELESHTLLRKRIEQFISDTLEKGTIINGIIAQSEAQARKLKKLREHISMAQKHIGVSIKHDISVPIDKITEFIERATEAVSKFVPGSRPLAFGHIGDGNIHFNVMQPQDTNRESFLDRWQGINQIVHDIVIELGGSISAEHGIGILKKHELSQRDSQKVRNLRKVKNAFDPNNILNPRVLFV